MFYFSVLLFFKHSLLMPQPIALYHFCRKLVFVKCILLSCSLVTYSQQTSCSHAFDSVKAYIEKNYVGFADKVNAQTQNAYQAHTKLMYQYAKRAQSASDYYFVIHQFLTFFKDHHLYITPPVDTSHIERIRLDDKQVQKLYHTNAANIEGIYYLRDSVYKVAVIKSKKGLRSYAGVIISSQTSMWKAGQVKFELIETGANQYTGVWYNRAHALYLAPIQFNPKKGLSDEGWYKHGAVIKTETIITTAPFDEENRLNTFFKMLNDSTGYLRIKSFDGSYAREIDSVVKTNEKTIQSTPRLIIDLRWNGGGSDHCMSFLKPVIYTNPVKNIGNDLLTTPDNTAAWEFLINQYRNKLPNEYLDNALKKIHQGDGQEKATVNFESDHTETLPAVWPNPAKVAIVINGGCGSSTEEFLLIARQSKKVKMVGEHSIGSLDYSNVVPRDFSCPPFTLHYPTTRSRRIDAGLGIDNKGIQPDLPLILDNDNWLEALERKW
jgi:hypothetical protein